ncbi:hypothetical protein LQE93_14055 [Clostridium sp. NSJ-145]|uniref:hypothetical protein n=1 Tax=Clostridium sp. NSJ-145 TaxID=2897777 RepID=UPI001E5EFB3A|nr:hypothetical protein [Clostridium sp. NSJ-145]MCD2502891.1 hypothetical protein [Clostridium sp. NSJ-145]
MNMIRKFKYITDKDYINNNKQRIIITIMLFVIVYSTFLLIIPGIPRGHDLTFHLSRISALSDGLKLGQFPVRIYPNYFNGYGYANGLFYGDIFLYIPAVLCTLGLSVITSYKIFLLICTICTALSIYLCVKSISKSKYAAVVSTVIYTLSSYRMVDVYIRAAIGEVIAFIFLPLVVLGIYEIIYRDKKKWYIITIGFSGLILSHNISAVIMGGFTTLILIINIKRIIKEPNRLGYLFLAAITTILIVSFFVFPMIEQIVTDKFVLNSQTINSEIWTTTMPLYKIILEIPYSLMLLPGVSGIGIVFVVILFIRFKNKKVNNIVFGYSDVCFSMGILSIIAVTKIFPWRILVKYIKQLATIQLSWRLYLFATLFLSISGGIILLDYCKNIEDRTKKLSIITILSIFACSINMFGQYAFYGLMQIKGLHDVSIIPYRVGLAEYLPEGTDKELLFERGDIISSNNDELKIDFSRKGTNLSVNFSNNIQNNTFIEVPLLYYLGYEATYTSNNIKKVLPISKGENNIIRIDLKNFADGQINVVYKGTKIQYISKYISLLATIIFIVYLIINRKRELNKIRREEMYV